MIIRSGSRPRECECECAAAAARSPSMNEQQMQVQQPENLLYNPPQTCFRHSNGMGKIKQLLVSLSIIGTISISHEYKYRHGHQLSNPNKQCRLCRKLFGFAPFVLIALSFLPPPPSSATALNPPRSSSTTVTTLTGLLEHTHDTEIIAGMFNKLLEAQTHLINRSCTLVCAQCQSPFTPFRSPPLSFQPRHSLTLCGTSTLFAPRRSIIGHHGRREQTSERRCPNASDGLKWLLKRSDTDARNR